MKSKRPKESNLPERKHTPKDILNKISLDKIAQRFFSICELKTIISHTKGHYGWKNLNQVSNERSNSGRLKRTKVQKHQKNAKGMGVRNKRI